MVSSLNRPPEYPSLGAVVAKYRNTAQCNDLTYELFTKKTNEVEFLKEHRDYVEDNSWGFGARAFHFMWYLLLEQAVSTSGRVNALEIGVYKGQVLSLWKLIGKHLGAAVQARGISPLTGTSDDILSQEEAKRDALKNSYPNLNYLQLIEKIHYDFDLGFDRAQIIKGYSSDPRVLLAAQEAIYDIIYIDGDHQYSSVVQDIANYHCLLGEGGFLVMDDASCDLPGDTFWKGIEDVSKACKIIPNLGFRNIINVGHNRVYQRSPNLES